MHCRAFSGLWILFNQVESPRRKRLDVWYFLKRIGLVGCCVSCLPRWSLDSTDWTHIQLNPARGECNEWSAVYTAIGWRRIIILWSSERTKYQQRKKRSILRESSGDMTLTSFYVLLYYLEFESYSIVGICPAFRWQFGYKNICFISLSVFTYALETESYMYH